MKQSGIVLRHRWSSRAPIRRMLAALMCLLMLAGLLPTQALAALSEGETVASVSAPSKSEYEVDAGTALQDVGLPAELSVSVLTPAAEEGGESATREEAAAVSWTGDYDKDKPAAYTLTAAFTDGWQFDGAMPTVTVTVLESAAPAMSNEAAKPEEPKEPEEPKLPPDDEPQAVPEPSATACTCDPKPIEGEAHQEGCPLYVAPVQEATAPLLAPRAAADITLTCGSDSYGSITEWMLMGDANRDYTVGDADQTRISDINFGTYQESDPLAKEAADINVDGKIDGGDYAALAILTGGTVQLPSSMFTFRVIGKPNLGYRVASAVITTPNNTVVTLTPAAPTSGNYKLAISSTGVATVTGQSLKTNDVRFTHEQIPAAITLTYGSDANGAVTEWMLKGDATRDAQVTEQDAVAITRHVNDVEQLTAALALESAEVSGDGVITAADNVEVSRLCNGLIPLPYDRFTFRVVDTPNAGYAVASAVITTPNGTVELTRIDLTSGNYALMIDKNGVATVTGQSLATNDVQFTHVSIASVITLTYGSDLNGAVTEWMLKGDINRDSSVSLTDLDTIADITFGIYEVSDFDALARESGDVNFNNHISASDYGPVMLLLKGIKTLPNGMFTFRVIDTPNVGYRVASAVITTPNGVVTLTPDAPTSGNYKLTIASNGVATVTGESLKTNDVRFTHVPTLGIRLTYGSDSNGSITEWMLKGDVDRDGIVRSVSEVATILRIVNNTVAAPTGVIKESADIDSNGTIEQQDATLLTQFLLGATTLPDANFTFRVVDTPNTNYRVASAVITTPNGVVTLTPDAPTSGNYKLTFSNIGVATVTGQSLRTNDVQFTHEPLPPAITLTYGSDAYGAVTEWMLKGDANRDAQVTEHDAVAIAKHVNGVEQLTAALALESAAVSGGGVITAADNIEVSRLCHGLIPLPYDRFAFRVVDTPNTNYKVATVVITTPNGVVALTPAAPTSGSYKLTIASNGVATVTGGSLATNDVRFTHISTVTPSAVITAAELNVKKTVAGNSLPADKAFTFTIVRTDGDAATAVALPAQTSITTAPIRFGDAGVIGFDAITFYAAGVYTFSIAETATGISGMTDAPAQTVTVRVTEQNGVLSAAIVKSTTDDTPTSGALTFTNTYTRLTGQLIVSKTVTNGGNVNALFALRFVFSEADRYAYVMTNGTTGTIATGESLQLRHGESAAVSIPHGVTYTVVEDAYLSYVPTPANRTFMGTISATPSRADYSNEYHDPYVPPTVTGSLTVRKTVTGDLGERNKDFAFSIVFNALGSYAYTGSKSGTLASGDIVLLKHGEYITVTGLPAGTTYSVTESGNSGYRVYTSGDVGVISANRTSVAAFTNSRSKVPITGDDDAPYQGLMLMLIALVGAAVLMLLDRRMKRGRAKVKAAG